MAKLSQTQKIVQFLKEHSDLRFTARDIAQAIITAYPEEYADKRANPRFADDKAFVSRTSTQLYAH